MNPLKPVFALLVFSAIRGTRGQPGQPNTCEVECPSSSPFLNVTIASDSNFRNVTTYQCPPYSNGEWQNPAKACAVQVTYTLPLNPKYAKVPIAVAKTAGMYDSIRYLEESPTPILGALGVMLNGVNLFGVGSPCGFSSQCPPAGLSIYVDAVESEGHTVDGCGGHAAPSGVYHIHSGQTLHTREGRLACALPGDEAGQHSELLGWAFDGFGIYGERSEDGKLPAQLDPCGGHTHEIDGEMVYHYHLPATDVYPWTIGCFKGCPIVSNNQRQLEYAETEAEFGCPEGLTSDPDPFMASSKGMQTKHSHVLLALCSILFGLLFTARLI